MKQVIRIWTLAGRCFYRIHKNISAGDYNRKDREYSRKLNKLDKYYED